jgi:hypothetical protein
MIDELSRTGPVKYLGVSGPKGVWTFMMEDMGSLLAPLLALSVVSSTVFVPGTQPSLVNTVELHARGASSRVEESPSEEEVPEELEPEPEPASESELDVEDGDVEDGDVEDGAAQASLVDLGVALDPYGLNPSHRAMAGTGLRISIYVVGGIGTGLMLTGVIFLGRSMKSREKVSSSSNETLEERQELLQKILTYDRNMLIFTSAGAGVLALATILYLAGRRQRARAASHGAVGWKMNPWTGQGRLGLTLQGRF